LTFQLSSPIWPNRFNYFCLWLKLKLKGQKRSNPIDPKKRELNYQCTEFSTKKWLFEPLLKVQCLFLCSNILMDDIRQTNFKTPQREIHYYKTLLLYNNNYCKSIISSPVDSSLHGADLMPFLITEQSVIRLLDKNYLDKIKGSWNSWYIKQLFFEDAPDMSWYIWPTRP